MLTFLNILAVIPLLLVYVGVFIAPDKFWPIAYAGLAYPYILFINILFILYWILRARKKFLISLIAVLLGWNFLPALFSFSTKSDLPAEGKNISVLSYNVRVFGIYNYIKPQWDHDFTDRNLIFKYLQDNNFDILCFQEFVHDRSRKFKTLDTIPRLIKAVNHHTVFNQNSKNINYFGLATFSRYPIVGNGTIKFPSRLGNLCIFTDIKIDTDTIRVYNVHFESIGLSPEDYGFVEEIATTGTLAELNKVKASSINILRRIRNAYIYRAEQVRMVTDHINECPYPIILAGDFNDVPASWSYHMLTRNLNDAFVSGKGFGSTYRTKIPVLRIDYIMHSNDFKSYKFNTGKQTYSDHYPISTWLNLKNGDIKED
jgi:endonuclease/exonuclease/phosphatase family metal-dependent hydrolase